MALVKRNGVLEEVKPGEVPSTGGPIGATTPLSATQAGASDDSAKMALTPQARTGLAAKIADNAKSTLEGAKRLREPSPTKAAPTPEEEAFQARLQKLGGLGGRIQQMVNQSIASAAQAPTSIQVSDAYISTLPRNQQQPYQDAVGKINQALTAGGAGLADVLADINTKFNDPMIAETLQKDVATAVASSIAKGVIDPDQININTLMTAGVLKPEDIGSEAELSKALGTSWMSMTPKQLAASMDRYKAKEAGDVAALQRQLNDPMLPPLAKEDIKDRLWELGYSGQVAREADVDRLAKQVEASGKITLNGEVRDIDEALADEGLMSTFGDYLRGDAAFKSKFQKANPELAAWLDKNAEGMGQALQTIEETDKQLGEIMTKNKAMFEFEDTSMDPTVIQAVFPDWAPGKFYSKELASNNKLWNFLQEQKAKDPKMATQLVGVLNTIGKADPDMVADALKMAMESPARFQELITGLETNGDRIAAAARTSTPPPSAKTATVDNIVDWLFGDDMSSGDIQAQLADLSSKAPFDKNAASAYSRLANIFDANRDGKLDDIKDIQPRAAAYQTKGGLDKVLKGSNDVSGLVDAASARIKVDNPLMGVLSEYLTGPADTLDPKEMDIILNNIGDDPGMIEDLYTSDFKMDPKARATLDAKAMELARGADEYKVLASIDPKALEILDEGLTATEGATATAAGSVAAQAGPLVSTADNAIAAKLVKEMESLIGAKTTPAYVKKALQADLAALKGRLRGKRSAVKVEKAAPANTNPGAMNLGV